MALPLDLFRPERMLDGPYSLTNPGISNAFTGIGSIKPLASKATYVILNHFIMQLAGLLPQPRAGARDHRQSLPGFGI